MESGAKGPVTLIVATCPWMSTSRSKSPYFALRSLPAALVRDTPEMPGSAALLRSPRYHLLLSAPKVMPGPSVSVMVMVSRV